MSPRLFCFGLGYSALRLARRLMREGWAIAGTTRSTDKRDALGADGIAAHLFARDRPLVDPAAALRGATHVLSSVPPDEDGDPVLARHGSDIAACHGLSWIGYLSTTGVYGDRGGAWVDEDDATRPGSPPAARRAAAEAAWLALPSPVHVFRLAGIYGPGRSAFEELRAGTARRIRKPGHAFSRIHVDDIAAVLAASMARPSPGAIYNVCDDSPAPSSEVVAYAARLLGLEPPPEIPFEAAELSLAARRFYAENRRVRNDRIKCALGIALRYPSYRDGLAAILAEQRAP